MSSWIEKDEMYYMPVARRQPIVITRGLGTTVWDENDVVEKYKKQKGY